MQKLSIVFSALLLGGAVLCLAGDEKPVDNSADDAAIRKVVDFYFKGVINADKDALARAWSVDVADMKYIENKGKDQETVKAVPIATAFDWWTRVKPKKSSGKVLSIDIVDSEMALVKFEFGYDELNYVDFLTLYKVKGEWKIVAKSFVRREAKKAAGDAGK